MAMLWVNGAEAPPPSKFVWGLIDVSDSNSGRTQDTIMHKNRVGQKRQIQLAWSGTDPRKTAQILQMFNPEYVSVKYWDAMGGEYQTRTFYVGDRSAPVTIWTVGKKIYESVSFNIIEQ